MRINEQIRARQVRLIGKDGSQVGVVDLSRAKMIADADGLDLVEISPNAEPPVCKVIDYGKYRYQLTKREKENKKNQHISKLKEIKVKPNIDSHDLGFKVKNARGFLEKGNKVKVSCFFRGREMIHTEIGRKVVAEFAEQLKDVAQVEMPMKMMGRNLHMVLAPCSKDHSKGDK
ncbi:translation initiation factor IF-3 [Candidatus Aerophobetes bacterium]|uniref:Translation initiation factor IF-3 n=1 Tax=Aerophobetes bacterium TaxID=2030807 RepID=A0A2A4WYL0_UNCAE|nr:MAG: translation initiation factor IF-3 [Candidatus Aerophobetes bacterium]